MADIQTKATSAPAGGAAEVGARAGWGRAPRETLTKAQRYSRFVKVMKRVLPVTATILGAALLIYALQPRDTSRLAITFSRLAVVDNDLAMIHPRLTGVDEKGQPYVVTADTAIQDTPDGHRARLKKVEADITLKDGTWLNVAADTGAVDSNKHTLDLAGNINIYSDQGYEAHTPAAAVDLKSGFLHGSAHIQAQGPLGTLAADGFEIHRDTKKLYFTGNVHTVFYNSGGISGTASK